MNELLDVVRTLPTVALYGAAATVALIIAILVGSLVARRRFRNRINAFLETPGSPDPSDSFSSAELLRRTRLVERIAERDGDEVVRRLGLDLLWTERLRERRRPSDCRRVMRWATETGLFASFLGSLQSRKLGRMLRDYLNEHGEFLALRTLALSGRGEEFSGAAAHELFADRLNEIREMAGDPEWPSRYFAVKILLHDADERSDRALQDAFSDPHPLVRRTVAVEYTSDDRSHLYGRLEHLVRHDPVYEVREAASNRIRSAFSDLYSLDPTELAPEEALHVVGLLDLGRPDDINAALTFLSGDNHELRLGAARFLARTRKLHDLFLGLDFTDRSEYERVRKLLRHALSVNVVDFLTAVEENPRPATLLLGAELLAEAGPQEAIAEIAQRVFRLQHETTERYGELYAATVHAIRRRGTETTHRLLAREIGRRKDTPDLLRVALSGVTEGFDAIYRETLVSALRNPNHPERDSLRSAFQKLDVAFVLATCLDTITADRDSIPHRVRIDALLMLGALELPYALQEIAEHLPVLPVETAREFTRTLDRYQPDELERKVRMLLHGVDAGIRAAVIAALPATGKKTFLLEIKDALRDADPDVRIAATWALVDYEETRAVNQAADMLRDPVPRVRRSVARALAVGGGKSALDSLRDVIRDENEIDVVKVSAIEGLGSCRHAEAADVLVEVLRLDEPLRSHAQHALASRPEDAQLRRLVEHFKDADPELRDRISEVFRSLGKDGEEAVRALLEQDLASLRPYLAEILEATGYVEAQIRLLGHRNPHVRRSCAQFLANVGNQAAFRGIVMAARDPDQEVRVQVTKALERLATEECKEILHALENDPDRRIRRYTHWALERLAAKAL
ncbi:MAG: HEAT repeat domain-containing protein [Spirochaetota bacterium]